MQGKWIQKEQDLLVQINKLKSKQGSQKVLAQNNELNVKITQNEELFRQFRETYERDLAQFEHLKKENTDLKKALNLAVQYPKKEEHLDLNI